MTGTPDRHADHRLQFLDELSQPTTMGGDVTRISDDTWAIYGVIPVDGDVILAEFDSYIEARTTLDQLSGGSNGGRYAPDLPHRL